MLKLWLLLPLSLLLPLLLVRGAWCVAAGHSVHPYFCTLGLGCEPGIGAEADLTGNSSLITAVTDFNSVLKALSEEHGAPAAARAGAASDADEGAGTKKKRKGTLADSRVTCVPVSMAVAALPCFPMRAVAVGVPVPSPCI